MRLMIRVHSSTILILSCHLHLGLRDGPFLSGFITNVLNEFFVFLMRAMCYDIFILLDLITAIIFVLV
jgi:hypothetical protein